MYYTICELLELVLENFELNLRLEINLNLTLDLKFEEIEKFDLLVEIKI